MPARGMPVVRPVQVRIAVLPAPCAPPRCWRGRTGAVPRAAASPQSRRTRRRARGPGAAAARATRGALARAPSAPDAGWLARPELRRRAQDLQAEPSAARAAPPAARLAGAGANRCWHRRAPQVSAPRRTPLRVQNVRLNNVEIPNNKRIEISLQYIYGIGQTTAQAILRDTVSSVCCGPPARPSKPRVPVLATSAEARPCANQRAAARRSRRRRRAHAPRASPRAPPRAAGHREQEDLRAVRGRDQQAARGDHQVHDRVGPRGWLLGCGRCAGAALGAPLCGCWAVGGLLPLLQPACLAPRRQDVAAASAGWLARRRARAGAAGGRVLTSSCPRPRRNVS
jgi:hypothetical protein